MAKLLVKFESGKCVDPRDYLPSLADIFGIEYGGQI